MVDISIKCVISSCETWEKRLEIVPFYASAASDSILFGRWLFKKDFLNQFNFETTDFGIKSSVYYNSDYNFRTHIYFF